MRGCRRTAVGAVAALGLMLASAGCTDGAAEPAPTPTSPTPTTAPTVDHLTLGVYGPASEVEGFRATAEDWNETAKHAEHPEVKVRAWPDHQAFREAVTSGAELPDVFLASRSDLDWLLENDYTQPVDELLDERGVEFGDDYSRDALQAFSANDRLQCMPYSVSPMVMYYNKDLVDFDRMRKRGLDAPAEDAGGWSFEQFAAAADFASRPGRGTKGVHIAPTLRGLTPFIESGGGSVFDDPAAPTSLTLSSDASKAALGRTLELLRNPQVTLDEEQLARADPLSWFERGKLGMLPGYRGLVPQLRQVPGLDFDVMPMPVLDSGATVGDVAGLCLSSKTASTPLAADLMVHELSPASVARVSSTGYLAPANLEVALSDDFLQPGRRPEHAQFFNTSVRSMRFAPLVDALPELEQTIRPQLDQLVYGVGVLDLDGLTQQIDEASRPILDPDFVSESPEPSESPSD